MPGIVSVWSSQIHQRNAAAAQARALAEEKRAADRGEAPAVLEGSDLAALRAEFHQVSLEARQEKPMRGVKIPRPLPNSVQDQINALPPGHELRRARDEGRIRYNAQAGRWVVDGVSAPEQPAKSEGGHFNARAMFPNTTRRYRR